MEQIKIPYALEVSKIKKSRKSNLPIMTTLTYSINFRIDRNFGKFTYDKHRQITLGISDGGYTWDKNRADH